MTNNTVTQRIRPWRQEDCALVAEYFLSLPEADACRMGCDKQQFPSLEKYTRSLQDQQMAETEKAIAFYNMWVRGDETIGFSSLKSIHYQISGEIHLHMVRPEFRGKGLGPWYFCKSVVDFFDRFHLKKMICEPNASNPYPNAMLGKIGFSKSGEREGRSSEMSAVTTLAVWKIEREVAINYLSEIQRKK